MDIFNLKSAGERKLNYMRLSVTDLCNLRCRYCMPQEGVVKIEHKEVLTYEEILRLARIGSSLGLEKLRLTGGEPLLRKGLLNFIRTLKSENLFKVLRITTNGILLADIAKELKEAGVSGINISLDAVDPEIYSHMAGMPGEKGKIMASRAWNGFKAAVDAGFNTKINCVPIRGLNDSQLIAMARLVYKYPIDVRFIEHMPIGSKSIWKAENFMPSAELINIFKSSLGDLEEIEGQDPAAPARLYSLKGALGSLGFISPVSGHFCSSCNRIRLTADGRLKPCLLTDREIDIKGPLRSNASDEDLKRIFITAAGLKPSNYAVAASEGLGGSTSSSREMSGIGG